MNDLKAVLWDMDGTLLDSEPFWLSSQMEMMSGAGLEWTAEDAASMVGNALPKSAAVLQSRGLQLSEAEIIDSLIDGVVAELLRKLPWQPAADRLLASSRTAGLRSALVTMSYHRLAAPLLDAVPEAFDVVVTGDIVERGKPDPEPYLRAASELGLRPEECIAFEDSKPGVASALAAGAVTVAVERHVPLGEAGAHHLITSFEGLSVDDLRRLHRETRTALATGVH